MKYHSRALAGTALGLFMAASAAGATSLPSISNGNAHSAAPTPLLMAQDDTGDAKHSPKKKEKQAEKQVEKRAQQQEQSAEKPEKRRGHENGGERQSGVNAGKAERSAEQPPARSKAPPMKPERGAQRNSDIGAGSGTAEGGDRTEQPAMRKHGKKRGQQTGGEAPSTTTQAPESAQPDNGQSSETKRGKKHRGAESGQNAPSGEKQAEKPLSTQEPAGVAKPEQNTKPRPGTKAQQPVQNAKPETGGGASNEAQSPGPRGEKALRQHGQSGSSEQNAGSEEKTGPDQKAGKESGGQAGETRKEVGKPVLPGNAGTRKPGEKPAMQGRNEQGQNGKGQNGKGHNGRPQVNETANPLPENAAPVLDSNKHRAGRDRSNEEAGGNGRNGRHGDRNRRNADNGNQPPANAGPAPDSDAAAQDFGRRGKFEINSVDAVKGKRIEGDRRPRWQRPRDADVVKEIGSRVIINLGGQTIVQSTEHERLRRHARDTYYEDLPHDRVRETIERPDGSRVVTIRNEYGDVIRRSRFTSDGREIVLVYVDDRDLERDRDRGWRDPGDDLPPMDLTIPVSQYILDSDNVRDPDRYYEFLDQPPVQKVERLYTLGDVRRSARLRDMMPRVDLDTINFDTGSAEISQDQVDDLQGVAEAMKRIIDRNPGETFLIEGHTDAVGDPNSNLALSDERAESVADVLTNDFQIPPENLVTQGYGEEYLKVDTDGPDRENRRVAIRRITPLVAPVAQQ